MTGKTTGRWAFRVEPQADQLVRHAAEISRLSLTDFVKTAALVEAERVVADRTRFLLARDQWDAFARALERPPRSVPATKRLLTEPSVFE